MKKVVYLAVALAFVIAGAAGAQMDPIGQTLSYHLDSGRHDRSSAGVVAVFSGVVSIAGAPWLGVHFDQVTLGPNDYVELTSLQDGDMQRIRAPRVVAGRVRSGHFNGGEVAVTLYVGPGAVQSGFVVNGVMVGLPEALEETICGADDRVLSNDARVCRLVWENAGGSVFDCTAFLLDPSSGGLCEVMASAGHCLFNGAEGDAVSATVHCNVYGCGPGNGCVSNTCVGGPRDGSYCVPGTTAALADQYDVPIPGPRGHDADPGNDDHAVFVPGPSLGDGKTVFENQGAAFALDIADPPALASVRVTGHGSDSDTPANSARQQTDTGPFVSRSGFRATYAVDTEGRSSGSPVIKVSSDGAYAIHTHGGCTSGGGTNSGTWMGYEHITADIAHFCPDGVIPTLSQWGLIVFGFLLLTAMFATIHRRGLPRHAAAGMLTLLAVAFIGVAATYASIQAKRVCWEPDPAAEAVENILGA